MGTFRRKSRETILKLPNLLDKFRVEFWLDVYLRTL